MVEDALCEGEGADVIGMSSGLHLKRGTGGRKVARGKIDRCRKERLLLEAVSRELTLIVVDLRGGYSTNSTWQCRGDWR